MPAWEAELKRVEQALIDAEARLNRLVIGYETGDLTGDEIALRRPQILADIVAWKERVSEIRKLLEDEEERQEAVRSTGDILGAAGDLDSLEVNEKRRLLANLRMRVIVYERENRMVLEWHGGAFLEVASGVADRVAPS